MQRRAPLYDKAQEGHYNLISALHKSLRGSDTDAALYWLARMLAGGEDPIYILRRLTRAAVEDIGLADPQAVVQALAAWDTYDRLGSPEGELAIAQCVIYLATAPKSNAAYQAFGEARAMARETGSLMPPMHILNAPTRLMRNLGYGKGYVYDHATEEGFSGQNYFPDGVDAAQFLPPGRARLRARDQESGSITGTSCASARRRLAQMTRTDETVTVDSRRTARSASTAGSSAIIPASAMASSKSCCAPGGSASTASARAPATAVEPGQAIRIPPLGECAAAASVRRRLSRGRRTRPCCKRAILHRDEAVIVLNKPPGLAVQGGTATERHVDGLLDGLRFGNDERPRLVHRLDKDTSGVLADRPHRGGRGVLDAGVSREDDPKDLLGGRRRPAEAAAGPHRLCRSPRRRAAAASASGPTPRKAAAPSPITG